MTGWLDAVPAASLADESVTGVVLEGVPIAIFRLSEEFFALHDLCPHGAARLSDGYVDDVCVECPLHQGLVDIRTGAAASAPITEPTRSYPVRMVDGMVQVRLA
ncbi:anthranilate 1,2-dioxygenase ferredoxin subunit AndAb [Sediminicoccus sp. KRV36]|uniref:anthranilate 1,2-dioxygenase ferredoxin subunit AndAb n=1 Tax=Sediminicoccus sp. KRV36 TaxID=3133721 RepID=UPI00200EB0DD|nr:anthranilate 1,2-dioxygenase ferredoxin subunit AndAb [Sediminicoccus rosea]UPY35810.1 non-heme iron oxygenase ferredoxin subunit [Sediminicoccus rosea]